MAVGGGGRRSNPATHGDARRELDLSSLERYFYSRQHGKCAAEVRAARDKALRGGARGADNAALGDMLAKLLRPGGALLRLRQVGGALVRFRLDAELDIGAFENSGRVETGKGSRSFL